MWQSSRHLLSRQTQRLIPLFLIGLLVGCSPATVLDQPIPQELAENACINRCQATKDTCDAKAHFDYAQCQAGYRNAWSSYRWCQSSSLGPSKCGYPWWGCSENLYGYCTNRYWECHDACRHQSR